MKSSQFSRVQVRVAARTDTGRVRPKNEDAYLVADLTQRERVAFGSSGELEVGERGVLLVVSDGMGGQKAGEVASELVVEGFARALEEISIGTPPVAQLKRAAAQAHFEVAAASRRIGREGMGATLTAVYVTDDIAYVAEVGDSRAYVLRAGSLLQLTRDQNMAQALMDAGAIAPEEAKTSPLRNILTQAMGHDSIIQVALGRLRLRDRDCLLMCSDGLTSKASNEEIRDALVASSDPDVACAKLVALANERGGEDNVTVVIAEVSGDLPRATIDESVSRSYEVLESFTPGGGKPPVAAHPGASPKPSGRP